MPITITLTDEQVLSIINALGPTQASSSKPKEKPLVDKCLEQLLTFIQGRESVTGYLFGSWCELELGRYAFSTHIRSAAISKACKLGYLEPSGVGRCHYKVISKLK